MDGSIARRDSSCMSQPVKAVPESVKRSATIVAAPAGL
jgi:hypothetical protein